MTDKQITLTMRSILEKLGPDASLEEEFDKIMENQSKLSFRERKLVVLIVARQRYLKENPEIVEEAVVEQENNS